MLYSTIEEAWNKPTIVETFTSKGDEACEKIISQLLKCDGCLERLHKKINNRSGLDHVLQSFYNKKKTYLLLIAAIITFYVLIS